MKFVFVSSPTFEYWDWRNPEHPGIGGSETSHVEMSRRLAQHGHEVLSFAPVENPSTDPVSGVPWVWSEDCDFSQPADVWVLYRDPKLIDKLPSNATAWLICQDVDYPDALTPERAIRFSRVVALCQAQANHLKARLPMANVAVSSNGIKAELIRKLGKEKIERNPYRLMYASSPDRGLLHLLDVFRRAKENVPQLELHVFYGFDNIDKVISSKIETSEHAERVKKEVLHAMDQPGVVHHGRMGQKDLLREWFKSSIWCHVSSFLETSCITCMDAQACGAIPITNPVWAVAENVKHGTFVSGDVLSPLVKAHYALELIRLAKSWDEQAAIRAAMMPWALDHFDWEHFVAQWVGWARADVKSRRMLNVASEEPLAVCQ